MRDLKALFEGYTKDDKEFLFEGELLNVRTKSTV